MTKTSSASSDFQPLVAARPFSSPVRVDVSALTHPGHVRTNNEDHFLVTRATRALETMQTSLPAGDVPERADEVNYVMVVADGMGGHAAGEVASRMAISALVSLALRHTRLDFLGGRGTRARDRAARPSRPFEQVGVDADRARTSGSGVARHGIDADRRSQLWPRPADRPRRRLARVLVPRRPTASPDQRPHLRATAGRHGATVARRRDPLAVSSHPDQRAWWDPASRSKSTSICCTSRTAIACCSAAMG